MWSGNNLEVNPTDKSCERSISIAPAPAHKSTPRFKQWRLHHRSIMWLKPTIWQRWPPHAFTHMLWNDIIAATCNIPATTMQPIYWDHSPHGSRTKNCPDHAEVGGGEVMENSNNHSLSQGSGGRAAGCSSHTSGWTAPGKQIEYHPLV